MAESRSIVVRLRAEVKDFQRSMNQAASSSDKMAAHFDANGQKINTSAGRMVRSAEVNREAWNSAGATMTAFGAAGAAALGLSAKAAIDWDSAWAGVLKTVDGSADELERLETDLRDMALELPASQTEIAAVAEAAGQLGVKVDDVASFTRTMINLGETTDLAATEAATALAQFANITGTAISDLGNVGSAIVDLGNNSATTESKITLFAQRTAAASTQAGLAVDEILGYSAAMASAGISAELGGTNFSKFVTIVSDAAKTGSEELDVLASVAGVTADEFRTAYEQDASGAIQMFLGGLADMQSRGESTTEVLSAIGGEGQEFSRVVNTLALNQDGLTAALERSAEAIKSQDALIEEANKRYETAQARIDIARNAINEAAITIGENLLPMLANMADAVAGAAEWFANLPTPLQETAVGLGAVTSAGSLAVGSFLLLAPGAMETYRAFRLLSRVNPGLTSGLGRVGKAAGLAGAAIGILAGINEGVELLSDSTRDMSEVRNELVGLADGVVALDGPMGSVIESGRTFSETMRDLNASAQIRDSGGFSILSPGKWLPQLIDGMDDAVQDLRQMDQAIGEFAGIDLSQAQAQFLALGESLGAANSEDFQQLLDQMPEYEKALLDAATASGKSLDETDLLALAMGDLELANDSATTSTEQQTFAWEEAEEAADEMNTTMAESIALQRELAGVALDERAALSQFEQALDDATASLETNGRTLDLNTQAGRDNDAALRDIADSSWDLVEAVEANGGSMEDLEGAMKMGRDEFIRTARQMGLNEQQANDLADEYGLIPTSIRTTVTLTGYNGTYSSLRTIQQQLRDITGVHTARIAMGRGGSGGTTAYAEGGPVYGPGTTTSDSILARLSNKEYVHTAAAHEFWGTSTMDAINKRDVSRVVQSLSARGFASGGSPYAQPIPASSSVTNTSTRMGDTFNIYESPSASAVAHEVARMNTFMGV